YRVHPAPEPEKLEALRDFLETLEISIPKGGALKPHHFNRVLAQVDGTPHDQLVNEVILRAQSQAIYEPANEGHFGLNLGRYAHFTSPIRRYADLLVHRALISAFKLGDDGLPGETVPQLTEISKLISERERRAMAAERETVDRLIASHLAERVGATFHARVSGVTRSGLFVRLDETGADGFVPARALDDDYYEHDEVRRAMVGTRSGRGYQLGDTVEVELVEAAPAAGALRFDMLSKAHLLAGRAPGRGGQGRTGKRGRSGGRRNDGGRSGGGGRKKGRGRR
ncbi:MAG: RNB domain-containing ribonuclease, partial [Pseudomonadota bacterium]